MSSPPPTHLRVETPRLVLRSPEVADAPAYAAMMSNPRNIEHDPESGGPKEPTVAEYEKRNANNSEGNRKGDKALWAVVLKNPDGTDGPVIGMGGFPWLPRTAEGKPGNTGALIDSAYWHKGYATETLVATLDYGFDTIGFEVIEQTTHAVNDAYNGLMKYMGLDIYGEQQGPDENGLLEMNYPVNRQQWQEVKAKLEAKQKAKA